MKGPPQNWRLASEFPPPDPSQACGAGFIICLCRPPRTLPLSLPGLSMPFPAGAASCPPAVLLSALHWARLSLGWSWKLLPTCPNPGLSPTYFTGRSGGRRREGAQLGRLSWPWKSSSVLQIPQQNPNPRAQIPHVAQKSWCFILPVPRGLAICQEASVPRRVVHTWHFPLAPLPGEEAKPWRPSGG